MGKDEEELRLKRRMEQTLLCTNITDIEFEEMIDNEESLEQIRTIKFEQLYDYQRILGFGGFGFVVSAVEKSTGDFLALKVRQF